MSDHKAEPADQPELPAAPDPAPEPAPEPATPPVVARSPEPGAAGAAAATPLEPYEKQPGESERAYALFCVYRNLGARRSLRAACEKHYDADYSVSKLRNAADWSSKYSWVERVRHWDAYLDREARAAQVEAIRAMNKRHVTMARGVQAKAAAALGKLDLVKLAEAGKLTITEVGRAIEMACKLERLAMGEVTEATRAEVATKNDSKLEVVEQIVPVAGTPPAAPARPAGPPTHQTAPVHEPPPELPAPPADDEAKSAGGPAATSLDFSETVVTARLP